MYEAQLNTMVMWFDQWSESGQTVALVKMLTRLAPKQARFLAIALDHSLTELANTELALQEQQANNPGFIGGLLSESKDVAMTQLLLHLPLLRPGNQEAKLRYLAIIPMMLNYSMETGCFVEEARQLLAYVLIHPALKDDRKTFVPLWRSLGEKIMNGARHGSGGSNASGLTTGAVGNSAGSNSNSGGATIGGGGTSPGGSPSISSFGSSGCLLPQQKNRQQRSNSLTPPFGITPPSELCTFQDDMLVVRGKNRRFSFSDHSGVPPLSPQSQTSSGSGSETHLDDLKFSHCYNSPGMKDMHVWLKSLRLHKYLRLFSQLTYDQMLSVTEDTFDVTMEQIDAGHVTQGARRKIVLSIAKLRERFSNLCQLEQDIMSGGNLLNAMDMLKSILATPMKPASSDGEVEVLPDDIPTKLTKVLGKVCTQLMVCGRGDEEAWSCFVQLLDSALHSDAFTSQQKRKISSWRSQITQQQRQMKPDQSRYHQNMFLQTAQPIRAAAILGSRFGCNAISPTNAGPRLFLPRGPEGVPGTVLPHASGVLITNSAAAGALGCPSAKAASVFLAKRPSLQDHPLLEGGENHANVQRTQSAPESDPELNSRLESLCLRMTEQALGGASEM